MNRIVFYELIQLLRVIAYIHFCSIANAQEIAYQLKVFYYMDRTIDACLLQDVLCQLMTISERCYGLSCKFTYELVSLLIFKINDVHIHGLLPGCCYYAFHVYLSFMVSISFQLVV